MKSQSNSWNRSIRRAATVSFMDHRNYYRSDGLCCIITHRRTQTGFLDEWIWSMGAPEQHFILRGDSKLNAFALWSLLVSPPSWLPSAQGEPKFSKRNRSISARLAAPSRPSGLSRSTAEGVLGHLQADETQLLDEKIWGGVKVVRRSFWAWRCKLEGISEDHLPFLP